MEVLRDYWPAILLAALVLLIVGFLILRPRQRVRLTDSAPVRPHMSQTVLDKGTAGPRPDPPTSDFAGDLIGGPFRTKAAAPSEPSDDFTRLKGVGPKFSEALQRLGFHRFDQLAGLTPTEIERLDPQLGSFRGRIQRDRIVEQADYLARGDEDGYEQKFGKL